MAGEGVGFFEEARLKTYSGGLDMVSANASTYSTANLE
jgi:hypothetical protein